VFVCSARALSACFRAGKRLEPLERLERLEQAPLVEQLEPLEQASLRCVQAMEGLGPQVKRKILSDNPRRFHEI
jgi:hypothetical protein